MRRVLAIAVLLALVWGYNFFEVWHPVTASPSKADAIVAIGGDDEEARLPLAEKLLREGYAPLLVTDITYPQQKPDCGSPTTLCIHPLPFSTRGEARAVRALAAARGWHSILLVVSDDQATRAGIRFRRCFTGSVKVLTVPTNYDFWYHTVYEDGATLKAELWQRGC